MEVDAPRTGGHEVTWPHARPVAALLGLLLIVGVAAGVWSLTRPETSVQQQADARPDAIAAASRFAESVNSYDVSNLSAYQSRVTPMLTPGFAKQFKTSTQGLLTLYAKTKVTSTGKVQQAAVESIDSDSAEVLVAVDADMVPAVLNSPSLRWQVSLVKQDGRWLVNNFTSIDAPTTTGAGS